jgi:hypothetical protein
MAVLLHILTRPNDPLAEEVVREQRTQPGQEVRVADLTQPEPDYERLLEQIFEADCIAVW